MVCVGIKGHCFTRMFRCFTSYDLYSVRLPSTQIQFLSLQDAASPASAWVPLPCPCPLNCEEKPGSGGPASIPALGRQR
ncbi:hypothetical protein ACRRTK_023143 [Alexandromys fortis]